MKDYFGADAAKLKNKKLWLFDMDGTIYEENRLFEGTLDLLEKIKTCGGRYIFITNNSSKSVPDYVSKLERLGIPACYDDFFTSAQATVLYLKKNHPHKKVFCMGTKSLVSELSDAGIDITEEVEPVDVVLLGYDTELTYAKLRNACEILTKQNPAYLATNPDYVCPVSFGFAPDCGAFSEMIKKAVGRMPKFIGKPEPTMIEIVREKYSASREDTVVIGDRLYTDIAAGINAGVDTICVLSGEARVEDIETGDIKPVYTLRDVKEIYDILCAFYNPSEV